MKGGKTDITLGNGQVLIANAKHESRAKTGTPAASPPLSPCDYFLIFDLSYVGWVDVDIPMQSEKMLNLIICYYQTMNE